MTLVATGQTTLEHARDAAYDIVLLAHVLSALVGLGAVAVAGAYALALRRSGAGSEGVRRYYRPGVNWAGRVLFLVPVFGVILVAMSRGDWSYSDTWIMVGLVLWVLIVLAAEMALWPEERQLQAAVADPGSTDDPASAEALRARCLRVAVLAAALSAGLVAATVVMVGKP
jgi:cytochrome bd-type quinol oxidase subunit 2